MIPWPVGPGVVSFRMVAGFVAAASAIHDPTVRTQSSGSTSCPPDEAVAWVRERYHPRAVETPWQRRWVLAVRGPDR